MMGYARSIFVIAMAFSAAACGDGKGKTGEADNITVVEVVPAKPANGVSEIVASGKLERLRQINLSFRVPGVLRGVTVDDGDTVAAGQTLATLDPVQYNAAFERAAAALKQAEQNLARDKALAAKGFASSQRLSNSETAVTSARAAYDAAAFDKRWTTLSAPSRGIILNRLVRAGEVVAPGQSTFLFADETSPIVMRAWLSDREVARVKTGKTASVSFTALPEKTLSGTIERIGERADPQTGAYEVEIRLPDDPALKVGFVATARIGLEEKEAAANTAVLIPADALFEVSKGRGHVFILPPGSRRAKKVSVGFQRFEGDFAAISGLKSGTPVITAGGAYIADGSPVRAVTGEPS